ncbi:MAG: hypothetical protein WBW05_04275 [Candidatus Acidiferrum sp.]
MITSIHTLIYSDDAPATRAFLRDVLGWPYVEDVTGVSSRRLNRSMPHRPAAAHVSTYGYGKRSGRWRKIPVGNEWNSNVCDSSIWRSVGVGLRGIYVS